MSFKSFGSNQIAGEEIFGANISGMASTERNARTLSIAFRIAWWAGVPFVLYMPQWLIAVHFSLLVIWRLCEVVADGASAKWH